MALQNIGAGNRDDAFYRYKMPRLVTKIEGRGNGIKTNVVNMVEVAKALARHPSYTTKYFGCELGAQSKFDEKTGTSIVNGAHETAKLAALLENFIKKYVQCYGCGNPETEVVITKTQMITLKCAACGFVSDVDMRDKLTTFILKNPPEQKKIGKKDRQHMRRAEKERLKEGEAVDEEMKKLKKDSRKKKAGEDDNKKQLLVKKKGGSDDEESLLSPSASQVDEEEENGGEKEEDDDDGVEWQTDTSAEAAKRRITEQLTAATSEMVLLEEDGGKAAEESSKPKIPIKESTKSKLLLKKTSSKKTDAAVENDVKIVEELPLHEKLLKDIKGCLEKGFTSAQLAAYLQSKEEPRTEVMNAYFEALFGGLTKGLSKEVGKKKQYLKVVVQDEDSQAKLLGAIEAFCSSLPANAGKEIAMLLKVLYDSDILEEEQILLWFDAAQQVASNGVTPPKSKALQVRKFAQPFVDWLRSAEAESEEEDDE